MKIAPEGHLTYCTNIHPNESWPGMWDSLKTHTLAVKKQLSPDQPFGIGLWLSNKASLQIAENNQLELFKDWLLANDLYVFTLNAFPYGSFHGTKVKDQVHFPDWTTQARLDYTLRLIDHLAFLMPDGIDAGLSTSPLSYKFWSKTLETRKAAFDKATLHLLKVAEKLNHIYLHTGKLIHLDLEPEPDGLIENSEETVQYFKGYLLPAAKQYFGATYSASIIEDLIFRHLNICYDVCHFAVEFEPQKQAIAYLLNNGIRIGKVQISAALKAALPDDPTQRTAIKSAFEQFNEPTYLHQVIAKYKDRSLKHFPDLTPALMELFDENMVEFRTHYHVPLFLEQYGLLASTNNEIVHTINYFKSNPFTRHLEVETYTWGVLPADMQLGLTSSIVREMQWVIGKLI